MRELTLLAIPECPLSAHARDVLDALAAERRLAWRELSTGTAGARAYEHGAPELLPALFDETGRLIAHGRLSERAIPRTLTPDQSGAP